MTRGNMLRLQDRALILPGSGNAIGNVHPFAGSRPSCSSLEFFTAGEAYTIKLRATPERTPTSMLVEAPPQINGTFGAPLKWRHMKYGFAHVCYAKTLTVCIDMRAVCGLQDAIAQQRLT
jgi:hypothetical protein